MKIGKGLKSIVFALCFLFIVGSFAFAFPYSSPNAPKFLQTAFYTDQYKCIYMVGAPDETKDEMAAVNGWQNYTREFKKSDIHYDGMGGGLVGFSALRIKACTPESGEVVALYIDNIKMTNTITGEEIFLWDFEDGEAHGPYYAQGGEEEGNMEIVDVDGNKVFLIHGKTINQYGNNGVEMNWTLPECPDTKSGKWDIKPYGRKKTQYSISFDYYFAVEE